MATKNLDGQLARLRSSFSNGQLAIVGVLSVIGVVATLAFLRWVSQPSYRPLVTGASAAEARDTTETLQKDGIAFKLTDNGTTVMVRAGDLGKARLATGTSGGTTSDVVGLELFDSQSFTTSDFQQRVGYQRALQGELTRSLLTIEGINSASVQLAMPPERLFAKEQKPTQASVLIGSDGPISSSTVKSIVQLVSSAVPGLEPEKVTVTNTRGQVLTDNGGATGDTNAERTTQYELELAAKAESMLAQAYGQGHVIVRVAATMNFDTKNTETTTYSTPDKAVPVRQSETTETFKGAGAPPSGAIGVEGSVAASGANDYSHTEKTNESVISSTVERAATAPGSVQRLTAAAIVDEALDPAPDPQQIERLIAAAIGIDEDRGDSVEVQTMKMPTEEEAVSAAREDLVEKAAMPITDYARIGIGALVLLIVLFVLRRGLRTTSEVIDLTNERVTPAVANNASRNGHSTPSELRLIDAEPAELANILRSWAGDRREAPRP
jgi:flagellar M-ring protein FliF